MMRKDKLSFLKTILFRARYFIIGYFLVLQGNLNAQLVLDFSDGIFDKTAWIGDVNNFKINDAKQLQLMAPSAGESSILTKYKVPNDSIQFDVYFKLGFAPSNDNFSKIYLFLDSPIGPLTNGYYIRLGENGSNDAIQIYKLTAGVEQLLGSGSLGAIAGDPADARVRMKIYRDGYWNISTDYAGGNVLNEDIEFQDDNFLLQDSMYFGVYCKYTSTRSDKFFYDDISIKTIERDTSAPVLVTAQVLDASKLQLIFSEPLEENSAKKVGNYTVDLGLGNPNDVTFTTSIPNSVVLNFTTNAILSGKLYTITASSIKDKAGNSRPSSLSFVYASQPEKGDLILTEVLTDPYTGGEDFIEVYNNSDKFLKLDGLVVANLQKNERKTIKTDLILLPKEYVAISANTDYLVTTYTPISGARFITAALPTMNVSGANITLISAIGNEEIVLDSFEYDQNYHFKLIDATKGVSLEKININGTSNDANNWHSASQAVKFATPGYINSNYNDVNIAVGSGLEPDKKVFSPNGDGNDDFLLLNYKNDKSGYLANINIYDTEGFEVVNLVKNYLLGTEGSILWDGIDEEGNRIKMGMYIIVAKLFHPDGDIKESQNVVVVANEF